MAADSAAPPKTRLALRVLMPLAYETAVLLKCLQPRSEFTALTYGTTTTLIKVFLWVYM